MCDASYRFDNGDVVDCEMLDPDHIEHRGYVWRLSNRRSDLAHGEFFRWQNKDEGGVLQTQTLLYTQSEYVVLRQALGKFVQAGYDSEAERIRGAVAQQLIRKLQGV